MKEENSKKQKSEKKKKFVGRIIQIEVGKH